MQESLFDNILLALPYNISKEQFTTLKSKLSPKELKRVAAFFGPPTKFNALGTDIMKKGLAIAGLGVTGLPQRLGNINKLRHDLFNKSLVGAGLMGLSGLLGLTAGRLTPSGKNR